VLKEEIAAVEKEIDALEKEPENGTPRKEVQKQVKALRDRIAAKAAEERQERELARSERAAGDAIYWPVFNLDRKNPNAKPDAEHLPPEQLVESILAKEAKIAVIVGEIKGLLAGGGK
jgi:type I restriction enzyme M protein